MSTLLDADQQMPNDEELDALGAKLASHAIVQDEQDHDAEEDGEAQEAQAMDDHEQLDADGDDNEDVEDMQQQYDDDGEDQPVDGDIDDDGAYEGNECDDGNTDDYEGTEGSQNLPDGSIAYSESGEVMAKKYMERERLRMMLAMEERAKRLTRMQNRKRHIEKWQSKTSKSPFHVNLVAEHERLDEEHRLRMMEQSRRAKDLDKRAQKAKQEVILKALAEEPDLELLRREKRAIIDEERRLKALMDLEKTNSHRKLDLIAAKNAEKRRRQDKEEFRRQQRLQELTTHETMYKQLLKEKLALE